MAARKLSVAQVEEAMAEKPVAETPALHSVINLDDLIREHLEAPVVVVGVVELFGRQYHVVEPQNSFHQFRLGDLEHDPMAIIDVMKDCVQADEQDEFVQALRKAAKLPTEALMQIVNAILEVALARPTSPSKPSSRRSPARRK